MDGRVGATIAETGAVCPALGGGGSTTPFRNRNLSLNRTVRMRFAGRAEESAKQTLLPCPPPLFTLRRKGIEKASRIKMLRLARFSAMSSPSVAKIGSQMGRLGKQDRVYTTLGLELPVSTDRKRMGILPVEVFQDVVGLRT